MKNILKYYFMIVGFLTTVFIILLIVFLFHGLSTLGKITHSFKEKRIALPKQPCFLTMNLVGTIKDREISELEQVVELIEMRKEYQLVDLLQIFDYASSDERIEGLVIKRLNIEASYNTTLELHDALLRFRQKGKKVFVFFHEADNKNYLLASAADRIYIQPEGNLYLPGISASFLYLKDTLDKIGLEAEFLKAGKYKSAPEIFTDHSMSGDTKKMTTAFLADLQNTFLTTIAHNRNLSIEKLRHPLDKALLSAQEALEAGLIDSIAYQDDFFQEMEEKYLAELEALDFSTYAEVSPDDIKGLRLEKRKAIGLIIASGSIQLSGGDGHFDEAVIVPDRIIKKLKAVEEDSKIKALIFRIDSPGGSVTASDSIWHALTQLNKKKPVFISMGSTAASGGYYIAMGADQVFANQTTLTGSIGVFGGKFNAGKFFDKIGVNPESIAFSEGASLFSPEKNFTQQQREFLQKHINETYTRFVGKAASERGMSYEELNRFAQGQVWTGKQAQERGLVDQVGGYYEVIQAVKKRIGLDKDKFPKIVPIQIDDDSWVDKFFSSLPSVKERIGFSKALDSVSGEKINQIWRAGELLVQEKILYLLPFTIEIQ